jgi:serine/threonine-protein kinase
MENSQLGRYEILGEIGRGAMGVVYRARDPELDRVVAIKTIDIALEESEKAQYEARFRQEARAAAGLNHPNIVTVHDIGRSGDIAFMAMEYIEGAELRALLEPGKPLAPAQAIAIAAQIAEGLAYAHGHGVVHRDVKPRNIMVLPQGLIKITDFGIARMRSAAAQTQAGTLMGSPRYMSPEQVSGQRADHRSDLFSLGIVLYEMLAGAPPFAGENVTALMYQIVHVAPPAPSAIAPAVPDVLDVIVAKLLAKPVEDRYQSAAELARDLRASEQRLASTIVPPGPATSPTFAPGARPAPADTDARTLALAQPAPHTRSGDGMSVSDATRPAHGVARAFDSQEATMRLASMTVTAASVLPAPAPAPRNSWSWRDGFLLACATVAGIAVALWLN